jgi:hypothetical protein
MEGSNSHIPDCINPFEISGKFRLVGLILAVETFWPASRAIGRLGDTGFLQPQAATFCQTITRRGLSHLLIRSMTMIS